jgi:asparagine synthase (glutamine-hydrolysing)
MCGIAGIIKPGVAPDTFEKRVLAMQHALHHRGPDERGTFFGSGVGLAATRLAIVDLAHGQQPMRSADGRYVVVFNGEIFNYRTLRDELDYPFRTHCDTEVVLAACIRWGQKALDRFNGMFSFCFYDTERGEGFLARDRAGVCPLVFRRKDGELMFASEVKGLLAGLSGPRKLHVPSFVEWAVIPPWSGADHSMFEDIEVLPAGCVMTVNRDGISIRRWWDYKIDPVADADEQELAKTLRETLDQSVRDTHVQADVPVAAYLSGGIDSTCVVASAKVDSFTVRFEGMESYDYTKQRLIVSDDSPFAIEAANAIGVSQSWVVVDRSNLLADLPRIAQISDSMPAGEQEFALHYLARAVGGKYKVVMVGDAADETHYGYHFVLDDDSISSPEGPLRKFAQYAQRVQFLNPKIVDEYDPLRTIAAKYKAIAEEAGYGWGSRLDNIKVTSYLVFRRFLARLLHMGDMESMAHSLEARVPFADARLLDFARRVPIELGIKNGMEKHLLRLASPEVMPDSIRWRRKSALPKDQGVDAVYRAEALKLLAKPDPFIEKYLNVPHLRQIAQGQLPLEDIERQMLFQTLFTVHWARHYGAE